uniref:Fucosyltransferase n=1 Tax=Parastrongyloides trichosuri TaxID=131310 RepID=A0A0N4ZQZ4_PARTI
MLYTNMKNIVWLMILCNLILYTYQIPLPISLKEKPNKLSKIRILMYTPFFGSRDITQFNKCKPINCEFTNDKSLFKQSDAVVFHFADINSADLPSRAFTNQKFVYFTLESPFTTNRLYSPKNFFNWIMSYNDKSDAQSIYGNKWIKSNNFTNKMEFNPNKILSKKQIKGTIGYISNCYSNSAREIIIDKLSNYTNVVIKGRCEKNTKDNKSCPKNDLTCEKNEFESYYFYFALENAICNSYITEKYWNRYTYDSIPIVMKRYIYTDYGVPNSSFIAVDDFKSAKEMGTYLNYLMDNPKEYLKYFEFRNGKIQTINGEINSLTNSVCSLCGTLRKKRNEKKIIENVSKTFNDINKCISKNEMHTYTKAW